MTSWDYQHHDYLLSLLTSFKRYCRFQEEPSDLLPCRASHQCQGYTCRVINTNFGTAKLCLDPKICPYFRVLIKGKFYNYTVLQLEMVGSHTSSWRREPGKYNYWYRNLSIMVTESGTQHIASPLYPEPEYSQI